MRRGLSREAVRAVAMSFMVVDHAAICFVPQGAAYEAMRGLGRTSYPLFAMLFADGCARSSTPAAKRAARLLAVAVLSEPVFDHMLFGSWSNVAAQNVMWSWLLALAWDRAVTALRDRAGNPALRACGTACLTLAFLFACEWARVDYGFVHCLCVASCRACGAWFPGAGPGKRGTAAAAVCAVTFGNPAYLLAVPFMLAYDPDKPCRRLPGPVAYGFYPGHLAAFALASEASAFLSGFFK